MQLFRMWQIFRVASTLCTRWGLSPEVALGRASFLTMGCRCEAEMALHDAVIALFDDLAARGEVRDLVAEDLASLAMRLGELVSLDRGVEA